MRVRKSHIRANKLDVQETDFSITVQQKLKLFLSMQVYALMESQLSIFGFILSQTISTTPKIKYEKTRRMDQQKPKPKIKMKTTRKYKETRRVICQNCWKSSRTIWLMKVFQNIETLSVLLIERTVCARMPDVGNSTLTADTLCSCTVCQRACPSLLSQLHIHLVTDFTH